MTGKKVAKLKEEEEGPCILFKMLNTEADLNWAKDMYSLAFSF